MSQLEQIDRNETYSSFKIETTKEEEKFFGIFKINKLNELEIINEPQPGITDPTLGSESILGLNKVVGDIDGINTRIEQNEEQINLLAQDVEGNTAQINIQADQITSLVSKTDTNYSLIQQNTDAIELRVTTDEFNSQIAITEGKIALKTGDSTDVKAQVVVDAINGGSVLIEGKNIEINGTTTFSSGYDPSTKETPDGAQSKADTAENNAKSYTDDLKNDLGDLAYEDLVEEAKLGTTIIEGGYLKTSLIDVDDIFAQNVTATGTITGGNFIGGEYITTANNDDNTDLDETVKLEYGQITFLYDGNDSGYLKLDESLDSYLRLLKKQTSLIDRVRIGVENDVRMELIYGSDSYVNFLNTEYVDFNGADLKDIDDLYVNDDIYLGDDLRVNYAQVIGDNFSFTYCPLSIPEGSGTGEDSMPSSDVLPGQMYLQHNDGYVAKLWVYDGEDWGYINLSY